ncbi:MAG: MATE family efflux transporter [Lachnospiraceae bacterium]|nr:MATE family efflux transporter [Lachnospiraceae bacterium]
MNQSENQITHGVIWKQLLLYFFPLLFGSFFQQLYNTVDAVIVGQFVGKEALAAVGGSSAVLVNYFVGFFGGLAGGASVVISQFYGAQQDKQVKDAVHTSLAIAAAGGVLFTLIGLIGAPIAVRAMGTPASTVQDSVLYLRIFFAGMVPNLVYNMGAGILRAVGDSRRPLYVLIISCICNIALDLLFVIGLHMGVAGVAIATILCQTISAVLVLRILMRSTESFRVDLRQIRFRRNMLGRIIAMGLPTAIQSTMYSFSNIVIQSAINGFDTDAVSAWAAIGKVDAIYWMLINSFGIAITTFVGQNYGAGSLDRVRGSIRQSLLITSVMTVAVSLFLYFPGTRLLYLFTSDADVIARGTYMMRYLVSFYITYFMIEVFSGALRGMGNSFMPMIITIGGVCILRMAWLAIMLPRDHTIGNVMASYPVSWVTSSLLLAGYYLLYMKKHHPLRALNQKTEESEA